MKERLYIGIVYTLLTILLHTSCINTNNSIKEIENQVRFLIGKNIIFPDNLELWKDKSVRSNIYKEKVLNDEFKIISVVDIDCSVCIREIDEWLYLKKESDSILLRNICIIVYTSNIQSFEYFINNKVPDGFNVFFDKQLNFIRTNSIPDNNLFRTMLLDKNNKVLLIGNPIHNNKLRKLYANEIIKILNQD